MTDRAMTTDTGAPAAPPCVLRAACPDDWPAVERLLLAAGLPTIDLNAAAMRDFVIAESADTGAPVLGAVAVQPHGPDGLLRSLVVATAERGRGLGQHLVSAAEARAQSLGLLTLTLLTESAAPFFARLNYQSIARHDAPPSLLGSPEFQHLCPASSQCMTKRIAARP